jgi:hypothetical protein
MKKKIKTFHGACNLETESNFGSNNSKFPGTTRNGVVSESWPGKFPVTFRFVGSNQNGITSEAWPRSFPLTFRFGKSNQQGIISEVWPGKFPVTF